jgi:hypothetical protein
MSDTEAWQIELQAHKRRLAILKEQAALQGMHSDPSVNIEIQDIERQVAELERKLAGAPAASTPGVAPSTPPISPGAVTAGDDVIIATVSASRNVVVGKQISQVGLGGDGPPDRALIERELAALGAALARAQPPIDPALAGIAQFQIELLAGELAKDDSETPSASTIVKVGDWLLANLPQIGPALRALLAAPPVARALARAGGAAPGWRDRVIAG